MFTFSVVLKFPNLTSKSFINNNINIPLSQAIILKFFDTSVLFFCVHVRYIIVYIQSRE